MLRRAKHSTIEFVALKEEEEEEEEKFYLLAVFIRPSLYLSDRQLYGSCPDKNARDLKHLLSRYVPGSLLSRKVPLSRMTIHFKILMYWNMALCRFVSSYIISRGSTLPEILGNFSQSA